MGFRVIGGHEKSVGSANGGMKGGKMPAFHSHGAKVGTKPRIKRGRKS